MKKLLLVCFILAGFIIAQAGVAVQSKKDKKETVAEKKSGKKSTADKKTSSPAKAASSREKEMKKPALPVASDDRVIGKTVAGKTVFGGPKGGQYTLSDKGEKAYLDAEQKKSVISSEDKAVGKAEDGKTIFEGPRGGQYTMSDKGVKVYLKRKP